MPAPTVFVFTPPQNNYPAPGVLRPPTHILWSGGVGPFDVLHEWDDNAGFTTPIQDLNLSATSPDTGVPPSDMGPAGTDWFYRVRVTDTDDSLFTVSGTETLVFDDPKAFRRYLYLQSLVTTDFNPTDRSVAGPDDDDFPSDGNVIDFRRYLHLQTLIGAGFDPTDAVVWEPPDTPPDGFVIDFRRYLYLQGAVGTGFDPTDGTSWETVPGDGFTIDFRRYLYLQAFVEATTPTPHIWYLFPTFGREGWEFKIVGYGFGDTQVEHTGTARLNALAVGIISWAGLAEVGLGMEIDPAIDLANPIHQEVRATVPTGGVSGLVFVETDDV